MKLKTAHVFFVSKVLSSILVIRKLFFFLSATDVFKEDNNFAESEEKYKALKKGM